MFHRSPRAAVLWCVAGVVALATALSVAGTLASIHRQDERYGRVTDVLVAARDLHIGDELARRDVDIVHARGASLAPGALRDRDDAIGRTVSAPALRGEQLTSRHLASRHRDGRDGVVPPGHRAMRVVIDDSLAPRPGARVDVYVTFDPAKVTPDSEPTLTVAPAADVLAVDGGHDADGKRIGVTLLVTAEEARRLAYATANGIITLALVPPEESRGAESTR